MHERGNIIIPGIIHVFDEGIDVFEGRVKYLKGKYFKCFAFLVSRFRFDYGQGINLPG